MFERDENRFLPRNERRAKADAHFWDETIGKVDIPTGNREISTGTLGVSPAVLVTIMRGLMAAAAETAGLTAPVPSAAAAPGACPVVLSIMFIFWVRIASTCSGLKFNMSFIDIPLKRPASDSMASQIIDEAKRMAVTFQMRDFTDKAAKELKRPVRPLKCKFCFLEHHTAECTIIPQQEKISTAINQRLCLTCLSRAFHLTVNCRGLKQNHLLCQNKTCVVSTIMHPYATKLKHPTWTSQAQKFHSSKNIKKKKS
ncbi:unnamed protein product [Caenorhabditis nigoni]